MAGWGVVVKFVRSALGLLTRVLYFMCAALA